MNIHNFYIKLIFFSVIYVLVHFISELLIRSCWVSHGSLGLSCSFLFSLPLSTSLLMSVALGWKTKLVISSLAGLIPLPLLIYETVRMFITGIYNQRFPEIIDHIQHIFFSSSLPCMIVAIAIAYATSRKASNVL